MISNLLLSLFFFWGSLIQRSDKAINLSVSKSTKDEREESSVIFLDVVWWMDISKLLPKNSQI
jgi:hypothetical protein